MMRKLIRQFGRDLGRAFTYTPPAARLLLLAGASALTAASLGAPKWASFAIGLYVILEWGDY